MKRKAQQAVNLWGFPLFTLFPPTETIVGRRQRHSSFDFIQITHFSRFTSRSEGKTIETHGFSVDFHVALLCARLDKQCKNIIHFCSVPTVNKLWVERIINNDDSNCAVNPEESLKIRFSVSRKSTCQHRLRQFYPISCWNTLIKRSVSCWLLTRNTYFQQICRMTYSEDSDCEQILSPSIVKLLTWRAKQTETPNKSRCSCFLAQKHQTATHKHIRTDLPGRSQWDIVSVKRILLR